MNSRELVKLKILELAKEGSVRTRDLYDLGFGRDAIEKGLSRLVECGKIHRRGHAKLTYYTLDPNAPDIPVEKPGQRSRSFEPPLPDLPENILLMMGYTRHKPNEMAARHIQGEW